ncbi:hypothetical protein PtA15_5A933 [Puccinia triticina]|uniref:Peptidase A1 domain-containing protein n=1 Tax=Puccinia triticina TaxID=208348 RepID=A0ABY7CJF1_9BASI|nr:uncharacterized protein PtA15_5A933 [Puccinia triticina]WAQ85358.1 hypothetical protein PtA15_5A933 [Puccinia triticina]WAR58649.1 hypothetical protein PtB15_5B884 [Puccinia triticina]
MNVRPDVDLAESTKELGIAFAFDNFDGNLGIGYNTISVLHLPPPFYKMMEKNLLEEPLFAFHLGSAEGSKADPKGGEVVFGGLDEAHYKGEIFYAPGMKLHYVGAAIDTGRTLLIALPTKTAEINNTEIDAKTSWSG